MQDAPVPAPTPAEAYDSALRAALARLTASLSPIPPYLASASWAMHLALAPGKCWELVRLAQDQQAQLADYAVKSMQSWALGPKWAPAPSPIQDRRFNAPEWNTWPYGVMAQSFLMAHHWWQKATTDIPGVDQHQQDLLQFGAQQILDMLSPNNYFASNPLVVKHTLEQAGANLLRGALNAADDASRWVQGLAPAGTEQFVVGQNLATTPGKVILRNQLIELLQYSPTTATVAQEPILIVPAWIMKYYVLDLSEHNSLIKYLVDQGHTVFCISWKNPDAADRHLQMDDYLQLGVMAALAAINRIVPRQKVQAMGYCLGGTLLAIAAAAMAAEGDTRLASLSLLAAQTDFSEPGELSLFIDESQLSLLDAQMAQSGYLDSRQMAGAFLLLRSYDLVWSRMVNEYLLGDRAPMSDLMAWNADATRMPATMHSQYLRRLFLNNDLSLGRYSVNGRVISLSSLTLPIFMVGTLTDHVAPWRSVYKLHHLSSAPITFALTSGGHNAGIANPPGNPRRYYHLMTRAQGDAFLSADAWLEQAERKQGSWWTDWALWLKNHSNSKPVKARTPGNKRFPALADAPGHYVLEK